jgi:23S rRNA (cytosine1962-C5)-methyltransferase
MKYKAIRIKQGREKSLFFRHPWVFSGAIDSASLKAGGPAGGAAGGPADSEIVDLRDLNGNFLARGYYNSRSNIAVRVLSFDEDDVIDTEFFEIRILGAYEKRRRLIEGAGVKAGGAGVKAGGAGAGEDGGEERAAGGNAMGAADEAGAENETNAYRVVFAEGDNLPGLIVDKYGDNLVVQFHTLGMDRLKEMVVEALVNVFKPACIYERSDVAARRQDGLEDLPTGILYGKLEGIDEGSFKSLIEIKENGLKFLVDIAEGQKTGFFLDQRENRKAVMKYAKGKTVLNLFCYSGGFSAYALAAGASHVTGVDISQQAAELSDINLRLNGFSSSLFENITADVFKYLETAVREGLKFDVVIVDPPAFVKSQKNIDQALKAYSRLNEMALRVLADNGVLVTSSCSYYVTPQLFKGSLFQAVLRAKKDLSVIETKSQPADHPVRLFFPEGEYLKFFVMGE